MAPFEYLRLIWAALFGYLMFSDVPDVRLALGAGFVLAAAVLAGRSSKPPARSPAAGPAAAPSAGP